MKPFLRSCRRTLNAAWVPSTCGSVVALEWFQKQAAPVTPPAGTSGRESEHIGWIVQTTEEEMGVLLQFRRDFRTVRSRGITRPHTIRRVENPTKVGGKRATAAAMCDRRRCTCLAGGPVSPVDDILIQPVMSWGWKSFRSR